VTKAYIGIGTNIGDRLAEIKKALELLACEMSITDISAIYETEPEGYLEQPDFLNCVAGMETNLNPEILLEKLKDIEAVMGRKSSFRNSPRIIDLDILLIGDAIISKHDLQVPHPRLHERAFVLRPLCDIAPQLIHPVKRRTMQALLNALNTEKGVREYALVLINNKRGKNVFDISRRSL
jgi:2-amino-4-hydroxy-6-hydroxymethyldihydropteridine diphosphokinase